MPDSLKPLSDLLSSGFRELAKRAEAHASAGRALVQRVRAALPEPLREHVVAAHRRGSELIVQVDAAVWSARVRYAGRALAEALENADGAAIERIRVRVRRPGPDPDRATAKGL
jgi:hypothetical protein